ncbi:MAG: hypothetical protein KC731_26875 [Myxococcales bacterium]|nr:hypothetical protein [Myxococcales bacterium]
MSRFGAPLMIGLAVLAGCNEPQGEQAKPPQSAAAASPASRSTSSAPSKLTMRPAPDGWYEVDELDVVPVLDDVGKHLASAQNDIAVGELDRAAKSIREGSSVLRGELGDEPDPSQVAALEGAAEKLDQLAVKVEQGTATVNDIHQGFAAADAADLEHRWVVVEDDAFVPFVMASEEHIAAAQKALGSGHEDVAASELRKASKFLRLEEARATSDGKALLQKAIAELHTLNRLVEEHAPDVKFQIDAGATYVDAALAQHHLLRAKQLVASSQQERAAAALARSHEFLELSVKHAQAASLTGAVESATRAAGLAKELRDAEGVELDVSRDLAGLERSIAELLQKAQAEEVD